MSEETVTVELTREEAASLDSGLWLRFGDGGFASGEFARKKWVATAKLHTALDEAVSDPTQESR